MVLDDMAASILKMDKSYVSSCPCCSFRSNIFLPQSFTAPKEINRDQSDEIEQPQQTPFKALDQILQYKDSSLILVDTHGHPHLNGSPQPEYQYHNYNNGAENEFHVLSLTCAVDEVDWIQTLDYAAKSTLILPALGVHPWYIHNLVDDLWIDRLEALLLEHPRALVGEIGLCKMAKNLRTAGDKEFALKRQRDSFKGQFELAARLRRPVTVHCVKQHGILLEILQEIKHSTLESFSSSSLNEDERKNAIEALQLAFPPSIGMHSFTGTANQVKQIIEFEQSLSLKPQNTQSRDKQKIKKHDNSNQNKHPLFYFGFSHTINVLMCSSAKSKRQGQDAIRAVPLERLLSESDVHSPQDVAFGTAEAVANIAQALDKPLIDVLKITAANGLQFLSSVHNQESAN